MPKPLVSCIMAARNAEKFVAEAVASVLHQTYQHWELICVDDASTDGTRQILNSFAREDERIKVVGNLQNLGAAESRNIAVRLSQGDFIAVIDADDVWLPDRIERSLRLLDKRDADVVGSDAYLIDERGRRVGIYRCGWDPARIAAIDWLLAGRHLFVHPSLMVRRTAWPPEGYLPFLQAMQDTELELRMAARGAKFTKARSPLCCCRVWRGGTITTTRSYEGYFCKIVAQLGALAIMEGRDFDYQAELGRLRRDPYHQAKAHLRAAWMSLSICDDRRAAVEHLSAMPVRLRGMDGVAVAGLRIAAALPWPLRQLAVWALQFASRISVASLFTHSRYGAGPKSAMRD